MSKNNIENFIGMEKLSLVDWDGKIATTLFTGGCNFRCPFCHNSALVLGYEEVKALSFDEIDDYLKRRSTVIQAVVITGGEPTLMPGLEKHLKRIKDLDYLIKLDTNGTHPELIKRWYDMKLIDYVAMDVKNSEESYLKTVGLKKFNLKSVLESIEFLKTSGIDYEFRTTLVNEFHTDEDIELLGKLVSGAKRFYLQHFVDKGTCIQNGLHEVPKEKALKYQNLLKKYVKNTELRGY